MPRNVLKTGMAITVSGNSINIGSPELIVCVIFGKIRKAPIIIPTKGSNPNAFALVYPRITGKNVKQVFPRLDKSIFAPSP